MSMMIYDNDDDEVELRRYWLFMASLAFYEGDEYIAQFPISPTNFWIWDGEISILVWKIWQEPAKFGVVFLPLFKSPLTPKIFFTSDLIPIHWGGEYIQNQPKLGQWIWNICTICFIVPDIEGQWGQGPLGNPGHPSLLICSHLTNPKQFALSEQLFLLVKLTTSTHFKRSWESFWIFEESWQAVAKNGSVGFTYFLQVRIFMSNILVLLWKISKTNTKR